MTSLEDVGFRSFISSDAVGAVATSSSELWLGGALALGAVFGAVYGWPKRLEEVYNVHSYDRLRYEGDGRDKLVEGAVFPYGVRFGFPQPDVGPKEFELHEYVPEAIYSDHPERLKVGQARYVGQLGFELRVKSWKEAQEILDGRMPEKYRSIDAALRRKGYAPIETDRAGGTYIRYGYPIVSRHDNAKRFLDHYERQGVEPAVIRRNPGGGEQYILHATRCMEHEDCREHPELGRACLMAQWDERWKEGAK